MLEIIEYGKGEYEFPALVVLGCFDAIHAGHRELLKKAKLQAKINGLDLGVMMFREGKSGKLVYSFEERCAFLEQYNVKFVLAVDFNEEFKAIDPLDFLHAVEDKINVKAYMSGKDFRFGAKAKGKSSTLKNYAEDEDNGVWYMPVKDVDLNGEKISTTLIKSCLDEGNVAKANELLGAEFSVSGEVVKGEGRGTSVVGFPTVNIVYPEWKHPLKHGVYSVKCTVGETDYQGIANFGNCPTFGDERVALEVYLEGFSGDLYGQILTVRFVDYIRDIEQFDSAEELSGQLQNDLLTVTDELAVAESEPAVTASEEAPVAVEEVVTEETVEEVLEEEQPEETVEEVVVEEQPEEIVEEVVAEEQPEETVEEVLEEEQPEETVEEIVAEEQPEEIVEEVFEEEQPEETVEEVVAEEQPEETVEEVVEEEQPEEIVEEIVAEEQPEETVEEGLDNFAEDASDDTFEAVDEDPITEEPSEEPVQPVDEVFEEEQPEEITEEVVEEQEEEPEQPVEEVVEEVLSEQSGDEDMDYSEGEEIAVSDELAEEEAQSEETESTDDGDGEEN